MSELFAEVHILDAPFHADRAYTYYVPPEMRGNIAVGMLASVPYGVANRHVPALVSALKDNSPTDNTKPILHLLGDGMCLSEEMLALCSFMKEYTLCSVGDAVRAVIPAAAIARTVEYYRVSPEGDDPDKLAKMGERTTLLYSFIRARDRVSMSRLKAEFGAEAGDLCASLHRAGFIVRETEVSESRNVRRRRYLSVAPALQSPAELENAIRKQRSPAQAEILRQLGRLGETAEADILALAGTSAAPLTSLIKKGLLTERFEDEYRNPFAEKITPPDVGESPLSPEQTDAFDTLNGLYETGLPKAALLHGVTGSGKTRVILAMMWQSSPPPSPPENGTTHGAVSAQERRTSSSVPAPPCLLLWKMWA